jgi:hypothetical protein
MGRNGRVIAEENTIEKHAHEWEEFYESLLAKKKNWLAA